MYSALNCSEQPQLGPHLQPLPMAQELCLGSASGYPFHVCIRGVCVSRLESWVNFGPGGLSLVCSLPSPALTWVGSLDGPGLLAPHIWGSKWTPLLAPITARAAATLGSWAPFPQVSIGICCSLKNTTFQWTLVKRWKNISQIQWNKRKLVHWIGTSSWLPVLPCLLVGCSRSLGKHFKEHSVNIYREVICQIL